MPQPLACALEVKKMINANLLPPEVKSEIAQTKKNKSIVYYFGLSFIVFLTVVAVFIASWTNFRSMLKSDQKAIKSEQAENEKYGAVTEKSKSLAGKITTIKTIDANTNKWSGVITEIQKVMPSGAYLSSVKIDADSRVRGQISGIAASKQIVASLRDSLEKSSKFQYVDIDTTRTQLNSTTQKDEENFTLSFSLEKGAFK
jgi:Tfp pilus assembly protein PilN